MPHKYKPNPASRPTSAKMASSDSESLKPPKPKFEATAASSRPKRGMPDPVEHKYSKKPKTESKAPSNFTPKPAPKRRERGSSSVAFKKEVEEIPTPTNLPSPRRAARSSRAGAKEKNTKGYTVSPPHRYWLMKAEPEPRTEKGVPVNFSIDDLQAATRPEPWDGVRNFVARNNILAMEKGDLVFFYHSNCKVPGIVGTMEIVEKASADETAFDSTSPYYDAKSTRENPRWFAVGVKFRSKLANIITLTDLKRFAKPGGVLEHMQLLKQSRLSVSQVTKAEWDFIRRLEDDEDDATPAKEKKPATGEEANSVAKAKPTKAMIMGRAEMLSNSEKVNEPTPND
ncbi:PUA-like domain-containing protein [Lineolata rhizophorae]|uniref:Thymocyte nuclear protein 1 n=1 Tax=Lineolata rhizophorae TaxID=578093 RepID=A0A6A6NS75_9PEZI|nr:PUA-like domain-containing protein [Lineolata rhizophorae]